MRIQCKQCGQALLVRGPAKEIDDLFANNPDRDSIYNCPWCTGAVGYHSPEVEDAASTNARVVTPHEAHMMLSQLGRAEERECPAARVRDLFKSCEVSSVDVSDIPGTPHSELRSVTFKDGSRLYLAPGGFGVTVYRITRPRDHEEAGAVLQETP